MVNELCRNGNEPLCHCRSDVVVRMSKVLVISRDYKNDFEFGLILKVRVFGTWRWPMAYY